MIFFSDRPWGIACRLPPVGQTYGIFAVLGLYDRVTRGVLNLANPYTGADRPPEGGVWAYIWSNLKPLRVVLALSLVSTAVAAGLEVWLISFAGELIDLISETDPSQIWELHGTSLMIAAAIILALRPLSQFTRHAANEIGLDCNIANLMRWRAHSHLTQQSVGWFQDDLAGRTSTRLVNIGNHAASVIYQSLNAIAFGLVYMIGIVTLMAGTDLRLALPLFVWFALYLTMIIFILPRMVRAQRDFQAAKSALVGQVVDSFTNFDTVKLFAREDAIAADHKIGLEDTRQALFRTRQIGVGMRTSVVILEGVIMVGFVGYGIWLWSIGAASIGLVASALALTFRITALAEWVLDAVWVIFLNIGNLSDSLKTVAQPLTIVPKPGAPELNVKNAAIELSDLHHQYGTGHGGLRGVSLNVAAGEKIGIVGSSGAGKSTLVNLILRFFEAERGQILIDGQDIRDVEQDSLRAAIGIVSQQASLLNRSVRANISIGQEGISDTEIESAARQAEAHEFIMDLRDSKGRTGYDAHVGERGVKLSGGQRQRIALARVILKNAPILILDEATSALDSQVEADIQAALQGVMNEKTVIAIAHRLSTIAQMDRIVVMDDGQIVEQGTHAELLDQDGRYAKFWRRQSGEFLGTDETPLSA